MVRALGVLVTLCLSIQVAHADDPLYACHAPSPDTRIAVSFAGETSVRDAAVWVMGFTCKNVIFDARIAKYATKVTILAPNRYTPKQAEQLFVDAMEAAGLVVVRKPDSFLIKLGPKMPQTCPDLPPPSAPPARAPTTAQAPTAPPALDLTAAIAAGVTELDATHHEITRGLLDALRASTAGVLGQLRVVPVVNEHKPSGVKLYAIRPSSLFAKLGFLNGDTVLSVNHVDLSDPDRALDLYAKLDTTKRFDIEIVRRGAPLTLVVTVR
jgi:hypothetical protein